MRERLADRVEAGERGQERRVHFYDPVRDALSLVGVGSGETKAAMEFFHRRASRRAPARALQVIFGGDAGGWPAGLR